VLTHRLWMSVISRRFWGRPYSIWKEEYVIDFHVKFIPSTFCGDMCKEQSVPGIVEVRTITFSDAEQVPVGTQVVERMAEYIGTQVYAELAGAYFFARMDPDEIRVETAHEEREVSFSMLRNHYAAMQRILARIEGERPPIARPWLGFIITYEVKDIPRILQVCFVIPDKAGNPPSNVFELCFPYDIIQYLIAWEWRPGQPDDIVPLRDKYITVDYDDPEDPNIELDVIRAESLKRLGIIDRYEVRYSRRGKHLLVWFKEDVPVYYVRRYVFHDDALRCLADQLRFRVTGVHDTLFTHKCGKRSEF